MIADTKFRRETSNFKLNVGEEKSGKYFVFTPIPDAEVENCSSIENYEPGVTPIPYLVGKLPKNLEASDLLGMVVTAPAAAGDFTYQVVGIVSECEVFPAEAKPFYEIPEVAPYPVTRINYCRNYALYYIPHCGRVICEGFTNWDIYPVAGS